MHLFIGDLQGCLEAFDRLLALWDFSPSRHRLTVVGDLVNRGPSSAATLRRIMGLGSSAQALLGNHDLHLLAVAHGVRPTHRSDTLADVLQAPDRHELLNWLCQRPLALQAEGWLCVHAGVPPQWDADQTLRHAADGLVAAGGLAAALSTADGLLLAIANALSHDIYYKMLDPNAPYLPPLGVIPPMPKSIKLMKAHKNAKPHQAHDQACCAFSATARAMVQGTHNAESTMPQPVPP